MFNNLCKENLMPKYIIKWTEQIKDSDKFYDLSELSSFQKLIKNILPGGTKLDMSLSAHLDILSSHPVDSLITLSDLTRDKLSIVEFKEIFQLVKNDPKLEPILSLSMHQLSIKDLIDGIHRKYDMNNEDFLSLFKIKSFQSQSSLGLSVFNIDHHITSSIKHYIHSNFLQDPENCLNALKNFISINSVETPVLYNTFIFDTDLKDYTVHNDLKKTEPFNFFKYQEDKYRFRFKNSSNKIWFDTLSHIFNYSNKEIDSFAFINISQCLVKTICIIQSISKCQKELFEQKNFSERYLELAQINEYLNINFLNIVIDRLTDFIEKPEFKSYHAAQLSTIIHILHNSISNLNHITKNLDYYQSFYQKCDQFILNLQVKFPTLIKDIKYNLSRYSIILFDLFSDIEIDEMIYTIDKDVKSVILDNNYSFIFHVKEILQDYPFDYNFSYSSLIDPNIDFDVFGNSAILYRNKEYNATYNIKEILSNKNNIKEIPSNKNISIYHQLHNHDIFQYLSSENFKFINSMNKFDDLYILYELGKNNIKENIQKEMKSIIDLFFKPMHTQSKFSLHNFYQFNMAQDKPLIKTSLFQQMLFRDLSIGFPMFINLFFNSDKKPIFFIFIDNNNINNIFSEFKYLLNLCYDNTEGINLFTNNQHWFSDKNLLLKNYINLIEFISSKNFSNINKQEIIDYNNNILLSLPNTLKDGFETIPLNQIFHGLNLKLSLSYKNNQHVRVKQKI